MNADISGILKSWEYKPRTLSVRRIMGIDRKEKIQIRINMGILQMEIHGRPDGKTPHDAESLIDYYDSLIEEFEERDGNAENFTLTSRDMEELDEELMQYYHRRTCFFALGDYDYARRDAEHNLRLMDIIRDHCRDKDYIESHERFRPFVMMERARAIGLKNIEKGEYADAMRNVGSAIDEIVEFYRELDDGEEKMQRSRELAILREWRNQIRREWEGGVSEVEEDNS